MKMIERRYTVSFLTPAFLGDAEQNARWRTPPFKHLLREWWRVVYFTKHRDKDFAVAAMREAEGKLFGHAWLENDTYVDEHGKVKKTAARQSQIRMRLLPAASNTDTKAIWQGKTAVGVTPLNSQDVSIGYAWFGLVRRGAGLPDRQRLDTGESRTLLLAWPEAYDNDLRATLRLIHAFATLGSRSRGGWGSLYLEGHDLLSADDIQPYTQPLAQCLSRDWAAAIACDADGTPWLWRSQQTYRTWNEALQQAARWRREVRTALKGPPNWRPALGFASPGRMPSPLRWKVVRDVSGGLRLQVVAMPHRIPEEGGQCLPPDDLNRVWTIVRKELDQRLQRVN